MTSRELARRVHANLLYSQQRASRLGPRAAIELGDEWLLIDAGDADGVFNAAIPTGLIADPAPAVDRARDWFAVRRRRCNFFVRDREDGAVATQLARLGFAPLVWEPALVLPRAHRLATPWPRELDIAIVDGPAALADYTATGNDTLEPAVRTAIAATAFAMEGVTLLLGRCGGEAIATSMCVVTGDVIGVFNVNVLPRFRRRGFGQAMTVAAIRAGAQHGGELAWLGSTPMSDGLYRRLGFREIYRYVSYVRSP